MKNDYLVGLLALLLLSSISTGQTIPFPPVVLPGNATNPVKSVGLPAGGYYGDLVVGVGQYGLKAANGVTGLVLMNDDVISCDECACQGRSVGRYLSRCGENHAGISKAFVSPSGFVLTDNFGSGIENHGPASQVYRISSGAIFFSWGPDEPITRFLGFTGNVAWFRGIVGEPIGSCHAVDMLNQTITTGQRCPTVWDTLAKTDSGGRVWTVSITPNGMRVLSGPTPTGVPATATTTPTPTPTTTVTVVPVSATSTPAYVCVTVTPSR